MLSDAKEVYKTDSGRAESDVDQAISLLDEASGTLAEDGYSVYDDEDYDDEDYDDEDYDDEDYDDQFTPTTYTPTS